MLLRRVARPLFASWFVSEGLDVVRHPSAHADEARGALTTLLGRLPAPVRHGPAGEVIGYELSDRQLTTVVQVHGAALAAAGILLSLNKAPRTAALALAALTAPLVLVNLPRKRGTESKAESRRDASGSSGPWPSRPAPCSRQPTTRVGRASAGGCSRRAWSERRPTNLGAMTSALSADLWSAPVTAGPLDALVEVPGSKSLTNRYLVLAALADAPGRLRGALRSRDTLLMAAALGALGTGVDEDGSDWVVTPARADAAARRSSAAWPARSCGSCPRWPRWPTDRCGSTATRRRWPARWVRC